MNGVTVMTVLDLNLIPNAFKQFSFVYLHLQARNFLGELGNTLGVFGLLDAREQLLLLHLRLKERVAVQLLPHACVVLPLLLGSLFDILPQLLVLIILPP
jgi:hypothetical protein